VLESHIAFRNYTHSMRVNITQKSDFYTQSVLSTRISVIITLVSVIITLIRVKITLLRVEITVVSVVITFLRVKITLRLEITLCV
jgi:hypothetical protein